jgi:hypothetical protein
MAGRNGEAQHMCPPGYIRMMMGAHGAQALDTSSGYVPGANVVPLTAEHHGDLMEGLNANVSLKREEGQHSTLHPGTRIGQLFEQSTGGFAEARAALLRFSNRNQCVRSDFIVDLPVHLKRQDHLRQIVHVVTSVDLATYCVIFNNPYLLAVVLPTIARGFPLFGRMTERIMHFEEGGFYPMMLVFALILGRDACIPSIVSHAPDMDHVGLPLMAAAQFISPTTMALTLNTMFQTSAVLLIRDAYVLGLGLSLAIEDDDPELLEKVIDLYRPTPKAYIDGRTICSGTSICTSSSGVFIHEPPVLLVAIQSGSLKITKELVSRCPAKHVDDLFCELIVGTVRLTVWQLLWERKDKDQWEWVVNLYYLMRAGLHTPSTPDRVAQKYIRDLKRRFTNIIILRAGAIPMQYPPECPGGGLTDPPPDPAPRVATEADDTLPSLLEGLQVSPSPTRRRGHRGGAKSRAKRDRAATRPDSPPPEPPLPSIEELTCPITHELFENPVMLVGDGHVYSRDAIAQWLRKMNMSPLHGLELETQDKLQLIPQPAIAEAVERYRKMHPDVE